MSTNTSATDETVIVEVNPTMSIRKMRSTRRLGKVCQNRVGTASQQCHTPPALIILRSWALLLSCRFPRQFHRGRLGLWVCVCVSIEAQEKILKIDLDEQMTTYYCATPLRHRTLF